MGTQSRKVKGKRKDPEQRNDMTFARGRGNRKKKPSEENLLRGKTRQNLTEENQKNNSTGSGNRKKNRAKHRRCKLITLKSQRKIDRYTITNILGKDPDNGLSPYAG